MRILGFNYTKLSATRERELQQISISTNIKFTDFEKEKIDMFQNEEIYKLYFDFIISYDSDKKKESKAKISAEGFILLSLNSDEVKEFTKSWKKKEIPPQFVLTIYNFLWKKCSLKAIHLEEDLGLPLHLPIPRFTKKTD
jgi:hypothetical protein